MRLAGINLTKLDLEKKSDNFKELNVSSSIDITNLREAKADFLTSSEKLITMEFEYFIDYKENIASLKFYGNLAIIIEADKCKEILNLWKEKKLPEDFRLTVFNLILRKAAAKALQFEEEFNLPFHTPLPSFSSSEKKKE